MRQNPALAHARPTHQGLSLLALTLRFSSPGQVRASRSSRSPTSLARRSKQPNPYPPHSCGANHCPGTPCATPSQSRALFLHPHSDNSRLSRALRAQEHEAAQGRVDGPLLGCPCALLERQGEPCRPCRAKSSREHQGHGGQGSRALRCALLVCRAGCHPQSSLNCRACACVKFVPFFVVERGEESRAREARRHSLVRRCSISRESRERRDEVLSAVVNTLSPRAPRPAPAALFIYPAALTFHA